jgi:ubiquinone biosynthesis protein COQ4
MSASRHVAPAAADERTWYWRIDPALLKEAAEIRRRDPNEFRSAVLTYFGFGGRDDGAIIERMRAHPQGRRIVSERIPLPPGVLQPALLADLPENTLGYQYWAHCTANNIDPAFISIKSQKVAQEYPATAEHKFIYDRYRDSHDLWHVVTGWGLDMAGEAGIIAWTYAQTRNKGYLLIFLLNAVMCAKRGRWDVFKTCWKGYRHGKRTPLLLAVDWHEYMHRPIDDVRRELGIDVAPSYPTFEMADVPGAAEVLASQEK